MNKNLRNAVSKNIFITVIFLIPFFSFGQNIGINTTGAIPAATNMLEVLNTSTTASSVGIYSAHSGAITGTGYGIWAQKTGASTTNVAGYFSASGATSNYAVIVPSTGGNVGIGISAPLSKVHVVEPTAAEPALFVENNNVSSNANYGVIRSRTTVNGAGALSLDNMAAANVANTIGINFVTRTAASTAAVGSGIYHVSSSIADNSLTSGLAFYTQNAYDWSAAPSGSLGRTEAMRIIGNKVGIGTTTPESLLEVQGSEGNDASVTLDADDGDDNADTWFITSQATDNDLTFSNHTTELMRLSDAGNLGIGTTPSYKLHVVGANPEWIENTTTGRISRFTTNSAGTGYSEISVSSTYDPKISLVKSSGRQEAQFSINSSSGTQEFEIGSSFASGYNIGTTSNFVIGLDANSSGTGDFAITKGNSFNGRLTDGTTLLRITNAGNVGIGTTTPETLFEVQGSEGNDASLTLDADDGDDNGDTWFIKSQASDNDLTFTNHTNELMRLSDDGNLGIGITPAARLDIYDATNSEIRVRRPGASSRWVYFNYATIGNNGTDNFYIQQNSTTKISLTTLNTTVFDGATNDLTWDHANDELRVGIADQGAYTLQVDGNTFFDDNIIVNNGKVGVGTSSPSAKLTLAAGAAAASSAPLKLTSGTNLTTPEAGAVEFDGTEFYATPSTSRYIVPMTLKGSASLDFGSTASLATSDLTITLNGAADGDAVFLGVPNASITANGSYFAWVSAANTITVRFTNNDASAQDPASGTFKVTVNK